MTRRALASADRPTALQTQRSGGQRYGDGGHTHTQKPHVTAMARGGQREAGPADTMTAPLHTAGRSRIPGVYKIEGEGGETNPPPPEELAATKTGPFSGLNGRLMSSPRRILGA